MPVKAEVGEVGVVTVPPAPLWMLQAPVPGEAALLAKVADVPQTVWSGPAAAAGAVGTMVNVTVPVAVQPIGDVAVTV